MLKYYNRIKLWGVQPNDNQNAQRSTVLLNEIVLTLIFLQSFIHLEILSKDSFEFTFILVTATVQFFTFIPVLLNYFKQPIAAKWYFNVGTPIFITLITMLYGKGLQAEFAYLVFPITIIIFFNKNWQYVIQFSILIGLYLFADYYVTNNESPLAYRVNYYNRIVVFIAMISSVAIIMWRFKKETGDYELQIEDAIATLQRNQSKIERQNKALEQANKELERFAYISSHNLKTPIRTIKSFSDLIERNIKKGKTDDLKDYINFVQQGANQMQLLTTGILEYSQINEISLIKTEAVNIKKVVEFLSIQTNNNTDKSIHIDFNFLPIIRTNASMISAVFQNLIENGVKYNDNDAVHITINYTQKDAYHVFTVSDNGIGIPPEYHQKVFGMFERLHTSKAYPGTGIGLAMSKKMIEKLNGSITLDSQKGKGSTFTIQLPFFKENS